MYSMYSMEITPNDEATQGGRLTRRETFTGAILAMWGAIAVCLGAPALAYLFVPARTRKADPWVEAGDVSALSADRPVEMVFRRNRVDGWKIISEKAAAWVVRGADGQVTAFGPRCTHLGCAHHWDEAKNEFVCPCHNSLFTLDGKVLSGPAPRPLDRYETKIQNSKLLLGRLRPQSGDAV
jgi:menaquinol-cytochrome c reductase iron-sulfur subunit